MLRLERVSKVYRHGSIEVVALRDVDLLIDAPGFTMVSGPSGSGKTTLLNIIGTLDLPSSGRISIQGHDVMQMSDQALTRFRAGHIGFIFQSFNLMPVLSAFENVEYGLLQVGVPARERRQRTAEMLEAVGLGAQQHRLPNELSGGQRQRVAIARALVKRPGLVLADEPTANLDSATAASIVKLMRELQRRFKTNFIFSTHDPMLLSHADAVLTVHDGRVEQQRFVHARAVGA